MPSRHNVATGPDAPTASTDPRMSHELAAVPLWLVDLDQNPNLYFFAYDGRYVLFRTDGLIAEVSSEVYQLLSAKSLPLDARWAACVAIRNELISDLTRLVDLGVGMELPQFIPRRLAVERSAVLIMITQTCNLACLYCYADRGTYHQPTKYQRSDNAFAAVDQLVEASRTKQTLTVTFFGGEPLLDFELIRKVVDYCKSTETSAGKKFRYSITTNATLVTDEIAEYLKAERFDVVVSFDGSAAFHDAHRPFHDGRGSFNAVSAGISRLVRHGVAVNLRGTLTGSMLSRGVIDDAIRNTKQLGAKWIHLTPVDCTHVPDTALEIRPEDVPAMAATFQEITEENITRSGQERIVFDVHAKTLRLLAEGRAVGGGRCGAFSGSSAVATNGAIYPCHRFVGMEAYKIGDVASGGIDGAKAGALARLADVATYESCVTCVARLVCGGLCYHSTADGKGGFLPPAEWRCDSIREGLRRSIGLFLRLSDDPDTASRYASAVGNRG